MFDGNNENGPIRLVALLGAPLLACGVGCFADLSPGHPEVTRTAAVAAWMAIWWMSGAVPLAVTALLPIVLFPTLNIMSAKAVPAYYVNDVIFLFLGGFLVALAMQHWDLHRRIALRLLLFFGGKPSRVLLGFMTPTFFLSMWISNTATTMMMVPIALSVVLRLEESGDNPAVRRFSLGLLLAIAYSASIGGTATLIGTPPNASFVAIMENTFPKAPPISFASWFVFGFPMALVLLLILWAMIRWRFLRGGEDVDVDIAAIRAQYDSMGRMSFEQRVVFVVFVSMALLWLTRSGIRVDALHIPGWSALFPNPGYLRDGTVAIAMALILFAIPSRSRPETRVLNWEIARGVPWDIILLFGGGFALAGGFSQSGLAAWVGGELAGLSAYSPVVLILGLCLSVSFLTELTSNAATTEMLLPIVAALGVSINVNPLFLMIPVTLSCSFAFMLPVATPPNALIFGTNRIRVMDMVKTGFIFNILGVLLVTFFMFTLGQFIFDIDLNAMPDWAELAVPAAKE
jgi:solute carrier family 13 (sodium-dependent dicarboxylate transporter), member 2/3/5